MKKTALQRDFFGRGRRVSRIQTAEHDEQAALMAWLMLTHPDVYRLTYAVPNGGHRHIHVARSMAQEGVKRGVPDLCIALPRGEWHGLYIEMKATGKTKCSVSDDQKEWIGMLRKVGYRAEVCFGFDEAVKTINEYLVL